MEICGQQWGKGHYWSRFEFLYDFVYRHRAAGWNIKKFYDSGHAIWVPHSVSVIRKARERRVEQLWLQAENSLRSKKGIARVGEGWVAESKLIAQLREAFPDCRIETQATPTWLGRMRFDAFFPDFNIAVEYQGEQHSMAVTRFGGEIGLFTTRARDEAKRKLCAENGCRLVDVFPDYSIIEVVESLKDLMSTLPRCTILATQKKSPNQVSNKAQKKSPCRFINKARLKTTSALGAHDINGCARHGTGALIRSLAESGTDFSKLQKGKSESLIYVASSAGNLDTLKAFLSIGLPVNGEDCSRGATALARLCNSWDDPPLEVIRILLEAGADVEKCAKGYNIFDRCAYAPPLIGAAMSCNLPLAQLLFAHGAKTDIRHAQSGYTAFLAASYNSRPVQKSLPALGKRLEMLRWLLANGADPFAKNLKNESALDIAISTFRPERPDFELYRFLMALRIPLDLSHSRALRLRKGFEIAPSAELEEIINYGKTTFR